MTVLRWVVTGRVQGVGFRWFVRREARALDLAGRARNLPDGSVEVVAEGPAATLADLAAALERGPVGARVERVSAAPVTAEVPLPRPFEIS